MSNKKSLCEVFEFFPDAQWITEGDSGEIELWFVRPLDYEGYWYSEGFDNVAEIDSDILKIDWQHRKTWKERCVSRAEIMEGEGEACMSCGKTIVNSPHLVCYKCGDLL